MKKDKKNKRPIEEIMEDILTQLKFKNEQKVSPTNVTTHYGTSALHYHNGHPCYNNPCFWC